jgi:hypothetical protein
LCSSTRLGTHRYSRDHSQSGRGTQANTYSDRTCSQGASSDPGEGALVLLSQKVAANDGENSSAMGRLEMDLRSSNDGEARFSAHVEGLTSVIGHADRAKPLRDYCLADGAHASPERDCLWNTRRWSSDGQTAVMKVGTYRPIASYGASQHGHRGPLRLVRARKHAHR